MKTKALILIIGLSLALLTACAMGAQESRSFEAGAPAPDFAEEAPAEAEFDSTISSDDLKVSLQTQDGPERLIIRTGSLSIVVEDTEASAQSIAQMAEGRGGWLVESNIYESNGAKRGTVTVRVPAEQFDATVAEVKDLALEVRSENTSSQDVTEEYVDLESRLANLEATADRVRGFLDEARNVEDALDVNRELSRLESDIEVIKGRMQYLDQSAAYSTLTVDLIPDELSQPIEIGGWRPEGVAKDAIEALVSALQVLANVVIWGAIFCLPLGLLVGVPLFFVGRFFYRRRQRRRVNDETLMDEPQTESPADEVQ